ncbi:MAG: hypothetical protein AB2374_14505 [Cytobacillus gottheilii]|uniref:hypothetical protein n=1 Tax=Cytobacillus gottheilii TaxID=859144 RepID=UPI00083033DB|nr:hypothetical protein [Cytobacillus gottheilii]
MVLALYFLVSWLAVAVFVLMHKRLSFIQNSFIVLVILIISVNWSWVIYQELKLIKVSTDPFNNVAFMINRSIAVPFIVTIAMNILQGVQSFSHYIIVFASSIFILSILAFGGIYFKVTEYINWYFSFDMLYFLMLNLIGFFVCKMVHKTESREVSSQ